MRTPTLLIALAFVGPAMAVSVPDAPTCEVPDLSALCVRLVVGPIVVGSGEQEEFNNDTYVIQGNVTVEDGGRVEIILSDVTFANRTPITVHAGGELVIEFSDLAGGGSEPPVIVAEDGASVVIRASNFTSVTLQIATDDLVADDNTHTRGNPAVHLVGFDGVFGSDNLFADNAVGLRVTGGSPSVGPLRFLRDTLAIHLVGTGADLDAIEGTDLVDGILAIDSEGTYASLAMDDNIIPPDVGVDIVDARGTTVVRDSILDEWGIAIRCQNSPDVQLIDNHLGDRNLQKVVGC